ncbi:hypothetical protein MNBD_ALPHA01-400 [hydrothermal vent metagenome]|uniref:Right handed beta helix domain-containing protein n=1 Tax=hydrothermal vent metagenome TaxID=652676 RepID=A0A3B0SCI1_9ZZZZ
MISRFLKYAVWTGIFCFYAISAAQAKIWLVGPDFRLHKPSEAIKLAKNGDIIKIVAGVYENDYAIINQDNLTIEGLNGFAHMKSSGPVPGGKAIWVTNGKNITIRNVEFSGARVPDKNGAGIRLQRGSLLIENCYFHDNQIGILTNAGRNITLTIKYSEFSRNILLTPQTRNPAHNIYIGSISEFIMENSISRGAQYGHTVKSRARKTILRNNRIFDEGEISASYLVDIPNGGNIIIENNYLYKNKGAQNTAVISYGAEGMKYEDNSITIKYNNIINEEGMAFLLRNHSSIKAIITKNETKNISVDEVPGMERGGFWDKLKNKIRKYFNK